MKPPDEVRLDLVRQWIAKAEQDLAAAEVLLKSETGLHAVVAFHAQQTVEKFLKAILVRHQIYFPKTHDIGRILDLVASREPATALALQDSAQLTPFGADVRYPGDVPEVLLGEEIRAVEIAREVRTTVLDVLKVFLSS